ncbi:hypothetical protein J2X11_001946 [Aeromicrobium panaciterrae]|uniref:Fibronectin type-III domain-containing protein n=1 Tax=Aeromicrobium panaciterrae TaxID=363861 RepID=A0ABU1UPJ6_9ACTN|nr:fibronectin type III domain-containing protein [Aeromicrobium panaciterrae]MDR7087107.1 hypothetical protein [Aeromicrobium panaciterrae]
MNRVTTMKVRAMSVAAIFLLTTLTTGHAAAATNDDPTPGQAKWSGLKKGKAALEALGATTDDVAKLNSMSEKALKKLLSSDPTVRVNGRGHITFIDPVKAGASAQAASAAAAAPFPLSQTFTLHSKPGSTKTIYLDLNGYDLSDTQWDDDSNGQVSGTYKGYSTDLDFTSFSDTERTAIQSIWQRVAEDYSSLDVDVTTQLPASSALDRSSSGDSAYGTVAFISSDNSLVNDLDCSCGGMAWLDSFDEIGWWQRHLRPALVLAKEVGPIKGVAEATSHEVGHTLGLSHDGTATESYYEGASEGLWAPIMGVGYYNPVTSWSSGEYPLANNSEDDFAEMATHGVVARADEAGGTTASALVSNGNASGFISTGADKDLYAVDWACTSAMQASASPAPVSPNLDIQLRLLDSEGAEIDADNPDAARVTSDNASGLGATVGQSLTPGRYYLEVDGVAGGSLLDGYTNYSSVGSYSLTTTGCSAPSAPQALTATVDQIGATAQLVWQPPAQNGGTELTGYVVKIGTQTETLSASATSFTTGPLSRASATTISVQGVNAVGTGASASVSARALPVASMRGLKVARRDNALKATWLTPTMTGKAPVTGFRILVKRGSVKVKTYDVSSTTRAKLITGLSSRYRYTTYVRVLTGTSTGPWSKVSLVRPY